MTSYKLLQLSEQFELMPGEEVDLEQFVKIMKELLKSSKIVEKEEFVTVIVDLFYRINKENDLTIGFEDITTYLIDHEIAFDSDQGPTGGGGGGNSSSTNMEYYESSIIDTSQHNNYIEKIYYFHQIDKVIMFEQNLKIMRIYDGATMKSTQNITCPHIILAIEFIPDKNSICVSLCDRTLLFFDASNENLNKYKQVNFNFKGIRKFNLPSTQKCLCYV